MFQKYEKTGISKEIPVFLLRESVNTHFCFRDSILYAKLNHGMIDSMKRVRKQTFQKKNLNEKMRLFFTATITSLVILMMIIATGSAVASQYEKTSEQIRSQLKFMVSSYRDTLKLAEDMSVALEMSGAIQEYCTLEETNGVVYQRLYTEVRDVLDNYINMNGEINFISVINENNKHYIYAGNPGITALKLEYIFGQEQEMSMPGKDKGSIRLYYGNNYYGRWQHTVSFYQPLYSTTILNHKIGMLCINTSDTLLSNMQDAVGNISSEMFLSDRKGNVISSTDEGVLGEEQKQMNFGGKAEGILTESGNYYFFEKVNGWNYYLVSVVPVNVMYQSSIQTICIMLIFSVLLLTTSLFLMRRIIDRSYEPVRVVVQAMDRVSENDLDCRIETANMGEDFEKLGSGFNGMMDDIQKLMIKVREEQKEVDQIRLNALQSQIQPHFLYNTLDCIHWQARADGSKETSDLVMALARYYRICLSKGKEIISLRTELEHIRYYLVIQNKRYGDIIWYEMNVDNEYMDIRIPKLTLQPLVENSIYHGIRVKEGFSGTVRISAHTCEKGICVEVADTGKGMDKNQVEEMNNSISEYDENFGYGVRNVNRRIQLTFGSEYGLHYRINDGGGITVEILLPEEYRDLDAAELGGNRSV